MNMRTTLAILTILAVAAFTNTSNAQESPEQRVKILPTSVPGVIKLHYAMEVNEPVKVTFFNADNDVLGKDKISGIKTKHGISKQYDVNKIKSEDFWMEIATSKHVLIYKVSRSADKKRFDAVLEPTSHQFLVRADN
jgi:hypothetical protein